MKTYTHIYLHTLSVAITIIMHCITTFQSTKDLMYDSGPIIL